MYDEETRVLNQQVKRHINKFPKSFMFQLSDDEFKNLKSQIVISSGWHQTGGREEKKAIKYILN